MLLPWEGGMSKQKGFFVEDLRLSELSQHGGSLAEIECNDSMGKLSV